MARCRIGELQLITAGYDNCNKGSNTCHLTLLAGGRREEAGATVEESGLMSEEAMLLILLLQNLDNLALKTKDTHTRCARQVRPPR